jgi:hypothetical protein
MFSSTKFVSLVALTLVVSVGLSTQALAKKTTKSQTSDAYQQGKVQLRAGQFKDALATFRSGLEAPETDQLETWQLLLGASLACEKLKQGADAIEYYRRFLDASEGAEKLLPPKWRQRRQVVSDAVDELQRKLDTTHGYLTISSTPPKAAIYVNGVRAGVDANATSPFGLFLKPGAYDIRLERSGYEPSVKKVEIAVGKLKPLGLVLSEIVVAPPTPQPTPVPVVASTTSQAVISAKVTVPEAASGLSTPGWALVATGGVVVVGGIVMTVLSSMQQSDMSEIAAGPPLTVTEAEWNRLGTELELYNTLGGVLYGVGTAAGIAGLVLVMLDTLGQHDAAVHDRAFQVTPLPGGAYGQATLHF